MTPYVFLFAAIFFTFSMISYLIHLNDKDLPLPVGAQIRDVIILLSLCIFWTFVIYLFNHPEII